MSKADKYDITNYNKVEDMLLDKVSNEVLNALTLQRALQLLHGLCTNEAKKIIKEADGEVLENLNTFREQMMDEVVGGTR